MFYPHKRVCPVRRRDQFERVSVCTYTLFRSKLLLSNRAQAHERESEHRDLLRTEG